jgi:hypothetical protein
VLVLRGITAADVPAEETQAQVNPGVADAEAVFTPIGTGADILDGGEVRAVHGDSLREEVREEITPDADACLSASKRCKLECLTGAKGIS